MGKSLDGNLIKKAHAPQRYTLEEVKHLEACMDPVTGPLYFCKNFLKIQHPVRGSIPFVPYEYQERLINSYHNYKQSIGMLPRQMGKTTCATGYLLWYTMFIPEAQVLIAAHKYEGAQDIMNRYRFGYENLPDFIRAGVYSYNRNTIEYDNGARIQAVTTTENTGRGKSLSLIYCDEFAFVQPPEKAKEFWTALSPTLSTGGKCIITSTPNSDEDQFALIWTEAQKRFDEFGNEQALGTNGFHSFFAHWNEHPDRDEAWAQMERAKIGEERFRREFDCEFLIFDETLINSTTLIELAGIDAIQKQGQVRWYKLPEKNHTYVVGLDPSLGTGGDPAAIQILELPGLKQVGEWQHNKTPIQRQVAILQEITQYIYDCTGSATDIYYSVENNTLGEAALISINEIGEENIRGIFLSEPHKSGQSRAYRKGFNTTNRSKVAVCAKFKSLVENRKLHLASKNLISELKNFVAVGVTFKAKIGETDDLVMSMLLCVRMMQALQSYDAKLDDIMRDSGEEYLEPMPFIALF